MINKNYILISSFMLLSGVLIAQDQIESEIKKKTIFEKHLSKSGIMQTMDTYKLSEVWTGGSFSQKFIQSEIKRISDRDGIKYFLTLKVTAEYKDKFAAIFYTDLNEIVLALQTLIKQSQSDKNMEYEYKERLFTTNEGFKIGYYQEKSKQTFFINLNEYQVGDVYTFKDKKIADLENLFYDAKSFIDELIKQEEIE